MSKGLLIAEIAIAAVMSATFGSTATTAAVISYSTAGSALSCNRVANCVQNSATAVTIGGLTISYTTGSGSGVSTPSIINLGNLVTTGTGDILSLAGLLLTLNINSTPPGASGTLPNGALSGAISTNSSGAIITFSPNNTTTGFGTLPGVVIAGAAGSFTYQVLNTSLGLQAPTVGNPVGQTSIQGTVTSNTALPEPATWSMMIVGFGLMGTSLRRRRAGLVSAA